jgi:IS1 family transposase
LNDEIGDIWTYTAISAQEKLIIGHVVGKRTKLNARKMVALVKERIQVDKTNFLITSDGHNDYIDAISSTFGKYDSSSKKLKMPNNLCYGQVIKTIEKGKCIDVEKKIIFGDNELLESCLNNSTVSYTINTSFIERSNLTVRQHNHRNERKTQGFSKKFNFHEGHTALTISYYNLCLPHSSLKKYDGSKPIYVTPAMEAKVTDKIWSMEDLLSANAYYNI